MLAEAFRLLGQRQKALLQQQHKHQPVYCPPLPQGGKAPVQMESALQERATEHGAPATVQQAVGKPALCSRGSHCLTSSLKVLSPQIQLRKAQVSSCQGCLFLTHSSRFVEAEDLHGGSSVQTMHLTCLLVNFHANMPF